MELKAVITLLFYDVFLNGLGLFFQTICANALKHLFDCLIVQGLRELPQCWNLE